MTVINSNDVLKIYEESIKPNTRNKEKIYKFDRYKMMNIEKVTNTLKDINYSGGYYNIFLIKDPKYRIIMSLNIHDKIINHYITKYFLYPFLENKLINRNVATRKGMGRDYAIKLIKKDIESMKKYKTFYILKLDMKKYFYSIDHNRLKEMLKEDLNDAYIYNYIAKIIDSTNKSYINRNIAKIKERYNNNDLQYYLRDKGLPIGNYSSQFLSIYYLYKIDYKIVHTYHIKHYVRYMDDLILIHEDKNYLKEILNNLEEELNNVYKLELNKKKTILSNSREGFTFCGYRFRVIDNKTVINVSNSTKKRVKKRVKEVKYLLDNNKIEPAKAFASVNTYYYGFKFGSERKIRRIIERDFYEK